jgi:xylulose-5-phosphate/fructose-6-phosphate phosphoketolase
MTTKTKPLDPELLRKMHAYWRAANYLSVGQIYLYDNPLLKESLTQAHIKPRLLGHWGTTPGLSFIYVHLNRVIKDQDLSMIYIAGPGHGGPALVANAYLEGTYSEVYLNIAQDEEGMQRLFKQFSFPGGIPSHVAPETPGSINEGGELGYSLSHAYGAAFDNPDLIVACVVGDGEAETGPLATSWHSNKFLNPVHDGAVLPILHLNGYKIAGPTVLARIPRDELEALFRGYGYTPYFVEGDDPAQMHQLMAAALDTVIADIKRIQNDARTLGFKTRPRWPMIILRSPKGWTGPCGRQGHRRDLPLASGADGRHDPSGASGDTGRLAEELSSGGVVRRHRSTERRVRVPGAAGRAAHERQSACQWRAAAARPADAGLQRLRGGRPAAGCRGR